MGKCHQPIFSEWRWIWKSVHWTRMQNAVESSRNVHRSSLWINLLPFCTDNSRCFVSYDCVFQLFLLPSYRDSGVAQQHWNENELNKDKFFPLLNRACWIFFLIIFFFFKSKKNLCLIGFWTRKDIVNAW